ncbi:hypothetical protein JYU07_00455 [Roseiflexus sp. AH-315-K22]|nr:hypothetical protein [Roseiflexus sp. AH-315-K22]MBN4052732.1 hypothetical protein [Roseiflexus sp. AH-315-K22]
MLHMKLRTKMMAMVSGVAMVAFGLGCAEESASPADSTANGEAVGGCR